MPSDGTETQLGGHPLPPAFVNSYSKRQARQIPSAFLIRSFLLLVSFLACIKNTYIHFGKNRNDKEGNKNLSDDTEHLQCLTSSKHRHIFNNIEILLNNW